MGTLLYAIAWLQFAFVHSLLARPSLQVKIESLVGRYYRLLFNAFALVNIGVVLLAGRYWLSSKRFYILDNELTLYTGYAVQLAGIIIIAMALLSYDIGRFSGITQIFKAEKVSASLNEPLQQNGLNRWVRHPLYTGAFLVLWGGAASMLDVWTAAFGTLYLVIGSRFEERKLLRIYGDAYRVYQRDVPRYFPKLKTASA